MWNERRSLLLSKLCVLLFMGALAAALLGAPWLARWLVWYSANASAAQLPLLLATMYTGGSAAAALLYSLYRVLVNFGNGEVFTKRNIAYMRRISWFCFAGGGIALVSALYYLPWLLVAVAAGFVGLIVRVVKNMMETARRLKEENDYTI